MKPDKSQVEAFDEFVHQFKEETDRAAVILGASKLDFLLTQLIDHFLVPNYSKSDELLDGDGPLSTFSAKINLAFRLGLIDAQFAKALHLVRRIRNDFAHGVHNDRLDTGSHRDRIRELTALLNKSPLFSEVKEIYFSDKSGPASDFFAVLTLMAARLDTLLIKITPLLGSKAYSIIPIKHNNTQKKFGPIKKNKR
jgi:DNA-binding MltR family transcriptional regulator